MWRNTKKNISTKKVTDDYIARVSLQDLLLKSQDLLKKFLKKKINLNIEKSIRKIPLERSPEITYGIRNFIGNAVKFSKSKVDVNLISNSTDVLIEVVDDGPGFPDDVIKLIGEPYISSKSKKLKSKAGLGLGTFIGKTLLERKKAEINFFNQLDKGAKVEISWKISDLKS